MFTLPKLENLIKLRPMWASDLSKTAEYGEVLEAIAQALDIQEVPDAHHEAAVDLIDASLIFRYPITPPDKAAAMILENILFIEKKEKRSRSFIISRELDRWQAGQDLRHVEREVIEHHLLELLK